MDYELAVETAPPGWRHFTMSDVERLPAAVRDHELARIPDVERELLAAARGRVLEVGAGSGRLTTHLAERSASLIAIEPSAGLASLLRSRLPDICVVAAWADTLPLSDGWSELTAACGLLGPDAAVLNELERVTEVGGEIMLISPEQPEWFEGHGWRHLSFDPVRAPSHDDWIDGFFGPPDPPHELVSKK